MKRPFAVSFVLLAAGGLVLAASPAPAKSEARTPPQDRIVLDMIGRPTKPPIMAVPNFTVLTADADTQAAAQTLTTVLRADLAFEREFNIMPAESFAGVPSAQTIEDLPYDRWTGLGADYVALG